MGQSVARGSPTAGLTAWISPQLRQPVDVAPDGDQWLHEIKYDGYRMHARLERCDGFGDRRKRARFGSVIPDVVDTQQAGHHGSLGPSTRRGPERYPVRGTTEALRRSAATRSKWAFAP
jgi:hypothetical protein